MERVLELRKVVSVGFCRLNVIALTERRTSVQYTTQVLSVVSLECKFVTRQNVHLELAKHIGRALRRFNIVLSIAVDSAEVLIINWIEQVN